jgi:HSP20 family protein
VEVTKMTQLMRYEPWWLADLERQMDELFGALPGPSRSWAGPAGTGRWVPACNVFGRDGDLVVQLDLPGIDPEKDVQVMLQDGVLCITGERRHCGACSRSGPAAWASGARWHWPP